MTQQQNTKFASDLHRNGEHAKIEAMFKLAGKICAGTNGGLAEAFITNGYEGYDCFAIIEQSPAYTSKSGYVLYDNELNKAVFIAD